MPSPSFLSRSALALFSLVLLPATPAAQHPEDPGPHPVGWRDVSFSHALAANPVVTARIYYPALAPGLNAAPDPASGPYPLVAFLHGYFAPPTFYDDLSRHVASWGFVVVATATETGFFMSVPNEAADSHALLHWTEEESANAASFLFGMANGGPWSAYGHSNGGLGSLLLRGLEPRVEVLGLLQPTYSGAGNAVNAAFEGRILVVGGEVDTINPPGPNAARYYAQATQTERKSYVLILGAGHNGALDFPLGSEPLSYAEQHRVHRRYVGGFLRAEVLGHEDTYVDLLGEGTAGEPTTQETESDVPALWLLESDVQSGSLLTGVAGAAGELTVAAYSLGPASIPTVWGLLGLDPVQLTTYATLFLSSNGVGEDYQTIPTGQTGLRVWFQSLVFHAPGGTLTRTTTFTLP